MPRRRPVGRQGRQALRRGWRPRRFRDNHPPGDQELRRSFTLDREPVRKIEAAAHARIGTPANEPVPDAFPRLTGLFPAQLRRRQQDLVAELGEPWLPAADRLALRWEASIFAGRIC